MTAHALAWFRYKLKRQLKKAYEPLPPYRITHRKVMERHSGFGHILAVRHETFDLVRKLLLLVLFPVDRAFVVVFQRFERVPVAVHVAHVDGVVGGVFRVEGAQAAGFPVLFLAKDGVQPHVGFVVF